MKPEDYLSSAELLKEVDGHQTDGCSFIGWLIPEKYTSACWAHDFGRQDLIKFDNQGDNDNMFRNALRHLGMPNWSSNLIYYFTKIQGWFADHWRLNAVGFIGLLFFLTFIAVSFYFGVYKYEY